MNLTPEQQTVGRRNFLKAVAGIPALAGLGVAAATRGPVAGGPVRVGFVGVGNMGVSHARAYHKLPGFEICGLMSRAIGARRDLPAELDGYPRFQDFQQALAETGPDAVSINTWPNTHADLALRAMDAGCHVFMEKPIATNI